MHEHGVPSLDGWNAAVRAEDAQRRRVEKEVTSRCRRQSEPSGGEDPEDMAVPEKGGVPICYAHPRDHAINARTDLFGAFPAGQPSLKIIHRGALARISCGVRPSYSP